MPHKNQLESSLQITPSLLRISHTKSFEYLKGGGGVDNLYVAGREPNEGFYH